MSIFKGLTSGSMQSMLGVGEYHAADYNALMPRATYDQNTCKMPTKLLPGTSSHANGNYPTLVKKREIESVNKKSQTYVNGIKEHVKRKLSLGAKILQVGGVEKVFKRIFRVREGEQLLKASPCYLSTTAGPIAGLLFISTHNLAFCSDRSVVKFSSPTGELLRFHYKVTIPLRKINEANQSENVKRPSQKYLQVVTTDDFEFWFMGFLNYKKTFKCLQQAVSQAQMSLRT